MRESVKAVSVDLEQEIDFQIEQSKSLQNNEKCHSNAPYIFYQEKNHGRAHIVQGCCNDWTCPRCGQMRARHEYARIVEGTRKVVAETATPLYFWTMTCRGRELSFGKAETGYLEWTNRLLDSARAKAKRAAALWVYAQVTERQPRRKFPHSHMICSYCPSDAVPYAKGDTLPNGRLARHACLWSEWFRQANVKAGLGVECDLSLIRTPEAAAVYVSKYLFKEAVNTKWPKGWRRVRYSRSWPKLPKHENETAFPLIRLADWKRMENLGLTVYADSEEAYFASLARLIMCVMPPKSKHQDGIENINYNL